jgi:multidrug efflux pump subunit AcrB
MGIVGFALRYHHTFYVLALMMLFLGGSAILTTPKDIFPNINIPVVTVIWQYIGLTPEEMEQRVTTYSEYSISSNVSDIRNIESQTLSGIAVEKIFFQPNVSIDLAISQIDSASNAIRALMPQGIEPPMGMTSRLVRQSALAMGALTLMINTPGQAQTEAAKAAAPTLHSSSQVSDAPGKGILPMISGHMAAGLSLYHLDAQPIEQCHYSFPTAGRDAVNHSRR